MMFYLLVFLIVLTPVYFVLLIPMLNGELRRGIKKIFRILN